MSFSANETNSDIMEMDGPCDDSYSYCDPSLVIMKEIGGPIKASRPLITPPTIEITHSSDPVSRSGDSWRIKGLFWDPKRSIKSWFSYSFRCDSTFLELQWAIEGDNKLSHTMEKSDLFFWKVCFYLLLYNVFKCSYCLCIAQRSYSSSRGRRNAS
jgi:hypothetical protein